MKRIALVIAGIAAAVFLAIPGSLAIPGTASASTRIPFQLNPAPFGNPNGSFDVPPIHCAVEVGSVRGVAVVTGTQRGRWGCMSYSWVHWRNLTNGWSGTAKMSSGLNGFPPETTMRTGVGQVVLMLDAKPPVSPGLASVWVP
ncbi:hypothetical protein [Gordonia asplenii]|uniref:hypothetical protein n=1 Tax=Gordonia asplenii TaxID=2725283 RepID=UPI001B7D5D95|nr:hypothetical protein [Gordonia asplenii]